LILSCRFANQETRIIVELCCRDIGVCLTVQAIFPKLNQFVEKHGFDWTKYKEVATNGAADMQLTTNEVI